ncbi:MAG: hypothetical protein N3G80_01220 [Candidatus Micrarchaeota archaeon]|nr:hypothetical protein [Candidatus Micrarchaeota archaeon]
MQAFKPQKGKHEGPGHSLRKLQQLLNEDKTIFKKKRRKIEIVGAPPIKITLKPPFPPPTKIRWGKTLFVRTCSWGNASSEALVRKNIHKLMEETIRVAKAAIKEKNQSSLLDLCLDPIYGINRVGFVGLKGNQLKADGKAVYYMIKQFFKDEEFIKKVIKYAWNEYFQEQRKETKKTR